MGDGERSKQMKRRLNEDDLFSLDRAGLEEEDLPTNKEIKESLRLMDLFEQDDLDTFQCRVEKQRR